jgi:hypothetical protein
MRRLRHIDLSGAGITVRLRDKRIDLRGHSLYFARDLLDERGYHLLLATLDEDIARYGDVVSVVEELADHAFRGEWRGHLFYSRGGSLEFSHTVLVGVAPDTVLRVVLVFSARLSHPRRSGASLVYEARIEAFGDLLVPGAGRELAGAFLREMAEVFGEPALRDLLAAPPDSPVVLYTNRRRFRTLGRGAR